jgi:tetratricopeptide (TPR) repeat protein
MLGNRARILAFCLVLSTLPSPAADRDWTKASTPHFELYTNGGDGAAKRTVLYFEQIRSFFLDAMKAEEKDTEPIRIIGFRSDKDYEPYRPNEFASAFYLGGYDRDYIVLGDIGAENHQTAVHEYVHLLVKHSNLKLPPWLNEGLADLYSTLQPSGNKVKVGALLIGRYQLLQRAKWIPVERILAVGHDSPEYNTKKHAGMFYSESWALTHMLNLDPDFHEKYPAFGAALARSGDSVQALQEVYGLSPEALEKELRGYIDGQSFYAALFDLELEKAAVEPVLETAPELEVGLALGQLTASMRDKRDLARKTYEQLAAKFPEAPEASEALGYMAWRSGDEAQGREQFARAAELGSTNPKMYYDLAYLSRRSSDTAGAIAALETAVRLNPEYQDARRQLGGLYLGNREWVKAVLHLNKVTTAETNKDAFWLYHSRAFGYFQIGQTDEAERLTELARKCAEEPRDIAAVEALAGAISHRKAGAELAAQTSEMTAAAPGEPDRPQLSRREFIPSSTELGGVTEYAEAPSFSGKLIRFDCLEQGARLHIEGGGDVRVFAIVDPGSIVIVSAQGGEAQFTCGPQNGRPIRVEYEEGKPEGFDAEGAVTLIELPD